MVLSICWLVILTLIGGSVMLVGLVHDHFDKNHLDKVVAEMKKLGTPKIKTVE